MKVVHLTSCHPASDIRILRKECRTLAEAGYDVVLIAPAGPEIVVDELVRIRPVRRPATRLGRMLATTRSVYRAAREEDAAVYHIHDPELLPVARRLRRDGAKVVFDMHENLPKSVLTKSWIPRGFRRATSWLARRAERRLLRDMPVIFAEDSYARDYPWVESYAVVRNMPLRHELARAEAMQPATPDGRPKLGYVGVVAAARGSTATLDALAILRQRGHEVDFECVGPIGPRHERELRERIGQLGLRGVTLHGYLAPRAAWRTMATCRVGLALLANAPNFVDSFPTKMFEYMALGMPVVASDFPLYRRIIESAGCGRCVDPSNPEQIARAVAELLEHPAEADAMGRRGKQAVAERYHWDIEAKKLLEFYEKLLKRGPGESVQGSGFRVRTTAASYHFRASHAYLDS